MSTVQSYRDLIVWRKSMALVKDVYLCTRDFPKAELYGLTCCAGLPFQSQVTSPKVRDDSPKASSNRFSAMPAVLS